MKYVKSKVEERKRLLGLVVPQVGPQVASPDKTEADLSHNIVISKKRMKELATFLVKCESCNEYSHNIEIITNGADVALSIKCELCDAILYYDPPVSIGKYNENTLSMVCNAITTGGMYSRYCEIAASLKTKPVHEKVFYEMRD